MGGGEKEVKMGKYWGGKCRWRVQRGEKGSGEGADGRRYRCRGREEAVVEVMNGLK